LLAETLTENKITSIAWNNYGEDGEYPMGIVAAGMSDFTLSLWDPNEIVQLYKNRN